MELSSIRDNLVDLTPEAQEFGKRGGGYEKYVLNSAPVKGRYLGIPHGYSNALHELPDQLAQGSGIGPTQKTATRSM